MKATILEIGPIGEYTQDSRKTRDLWGSSFLFSYMMGVVATLIEKRLKPVCINDVIIKPTIKDDQLFKAIKAEKSGSPILESVVAGTINDQMIVVHNDEGLVEHIETEFKRELKRIFDKCVNAQYQVMTKEEKERVQNYCLRISGISYSQILEFFRLFHVTIDIEGDEITPEERELLETASSARGRVHTFYGYVDEHNTVSNKHEKCTLCGTRKKLITLNQTRRINRDEHLCGVCMIKRGLISEKQSIIKQDPGFKSTTKIAAKYVSFVLVKALQSDLLREEIYDFLKAYFLQRPPERNKREVPKPYVLDEDDHQLEEICYKAGEDSVDVEDFIPLDEFLRGDHEEELIETLVKYFPYEYLFTDDRPAIILRKSLKNYIKNNPDIDIETKTWIDNTYYAIVTTDGDGTGEIFNNNDGKMGKISEQIAEFNTFAADVIEKSGGQLIYAGGEDVLFLVHPSDVFEVVEKFNRKFNEKIGKAIDKNYDPSQNLYTISAGVYICKHKHPLKLAIRGADKMIRKAKEIEGKGHMKVNLVKGQGEEGFMTLRIPHEPSRTDVFSVPNFNALIQQFIDKGIPRGFVFKLDEQAKLYSRISDNKETFVNCVRNLWEKSVEKSLKALFSWEAPLTEDEIPEACKETKTKGSMEALVLNSIFEQAGEEKINWKPLRERLYMARFFTGGIE